MRWSEADCLSRVVLTHAPRQATVSLILGVRQKNKMRTILLLLVSALLAGCVSVKRQEVISASSFVRLYEAPPRAPSHNVYRGIRNGHAVVDTYSPEPTGSFAVFQRRYLCPISDLPADFQQHVKKGELMTIAEPVRLLGW